MVTCPACGEENPAKFRLCGYCGAALSGSPVAVLPAHDVRKTVTLIFCDLKGSTELGERLDPETVRDIVDRYFKSMAAEILRHGGRIEKYIGDAIMAVFGLPRANEDDALRAVRAAAGMRDALRRVNDDLLARYGIALATRTGVNTGEVVASDDPAAAQQLATGDAVNLAARLEQAAAANEIYIGESTYRLVRDAVDVESVEPLVLKGKSGRVPAFRLISVHGFEGRSRRHDTPLVGRDAELASLGDVYREVCAGAAIRMVTIIGDAGAGKSRLMREVVDSVCTGARFLFGRCLPYGDGITFWPLREMVCAAAGIRADDSPQSAYDRLLACVGDQDVADRLAAATGLRPTPFPLPELYWAARRFLETMAGDGPLVAMVDDIHWAEPAFLDLLEHLLDTPSTERVLMLATARPDLLEERAQWGERPGATRLVLHPLSDSASSRVVGNLLGSADIPLDVVERIVVAAEGNPLFVEQMLSMLIDRHALRQEDGRWVRTEQWSDISVPPTIQALLEARLDRLDRGARATVEPAAVIGMQFALPAVQALAPEAARRSIDEHLSMLTRKQFIHPAPSAEQDLLYRFHHHLVRETVYGGMLKRARAGLHIEFVRWADRINAERDRALEFEEILGYHLEQAHRYLCELGALDDTGRSIGADAARRLGSAGRRAFARADMNAAANLYRRAVALLAEQDSSRFALLSELGEALMELGEFAEALRILDGAAAAAERVGDAAASASARLVGMLVRLHSAESGDWSEETLRVANQAIPILEREGANDALATAWRLVSLVHGVAGRFVQAVDATRKVIDHAQRAGNQRLVARCAMGLALGAQFGPTRVVEAIDWCEKILADGLIDRQVESGILCTIAQLKAMNGEFDAARTLYRRGRALVEELGRAVRAAASGSALARIELLAGDLAGAERELRLDHAFLARIGEGYFLSTMAALLARIVRDQGRDTEAMELSRLAEATAAADDADAQILWRSVRAPIVARAGEWIEAERLARSALELARETEDPVSQADALSDLAEVLRIAGRQQAAREALAEAAALYDAKGDIVSAARARIAAQRPAPA